MVQSKDLVGAIQESCGTVKGSRHSVMILFLSQAFLFLLPEGSATEALRVGVTCVISRTFFLRFTPSVALRLPSFFSSSPILEFEFPGSSFQFLLGSFSVLFRVHSETQFRSHLGVPGETRKRPLSAMDKKRA